MPLHGEYAPGTSAWARKQAERYEASNGAEAADLRGRPIIVLTSVGARTGRLRKTALMRVEHEGVYAVVASKGGTPSHPVWYHNLVANPHVELQERTDAARLPRPRGGRPRTGDLVGPRRPRLARLRELPAPHGAHHPGLRARADGRPRPT